MRIGNLLLAATLAVAGALTTGCGPEAEDSTTTSTGSGTTTATETRAETTGSGMQTPPPPSTDENLPATTFGRVPNNGDEVAVLETSKGRIVLMFYPEIAPKHVESFKKLVNDKFYDGTRFHRCIPGFMIQGGDPKSRNLAEASDWGTGGPDFNLKAEFNELKHTRGVLSMARSSSPDSAGSQFFVMVRDTPNLDGQYTGFGYAVEGMDVVDEIVKTGDPNQNGAVNPQNAVVLKSARIAKWPL